jgi:hypothetical protein
VSTEENWAGFEPPDGSVPWSCPWCHGQVFWVGMLRDNPAVQCLSCRKVLPLNGGLDPSAWLKRAAWWPMRKDLPRTPAVVWPHPTEPRLDRDGPMPAQQRPDLEREP